MVKILVSGLINIETTLRIDHFPLDYYPVTYPFGGVNSTVSGVGYNVAKALTTLDDDVAFLSLIGQGLQAALVRQALLGDQIAADFVLSAIQQTPQSVILYDSGGRRQIHVDLKDLQEQVYPSAQFEVAVQDCDLAVLCNINFSRPLLHAAKARGILIATDVHVISDLEDDYNRDFMAAADILFMSDEHLPMAPEAWAREVLARYRPQVLVIGLGSQGALLALRDQADVLRLPAVYTRDVVNTIGAGDALFSAFVHSYVHTRNAYAALQKAMLFASYKVGESGAAQGFLRGAELDAWVAKVSHNNN